MTAAGSTETYEAMSAAIADAGVRVIVITGGLPGVFIRHYDVGELSVMSDNLGAPRPRLSPPRQRSAAAGLPRTHRPDRRR